jgi:uncharacterized protein YbjT (DUF2867 family)
MAKTILITGATGNVAGAILPHLKNQGVTVRGLVRDPGSAKAKALGVELVKGDLDAHHGLPAAFAGADTVVIIHPPGPMAPAQSSNALWAAKQVGAKRFVRLSAIGAGYDAPTINGRMHGLSDAEVAASGLPYTIVKPHFFMQNMMMAAGTVAKDGAIYMPLADGKLPMIDIRDIGEFFARVLLGDGHDGRTYTITGPGAITLHDFAAALGRALGKPVKYMPVPVEAAVQGMRGLGMNDWMVGMMVDYFNAYSRSWASAVTRDFAQVVGHGARAIDDFARDFAGAFKG